MEFPAVLRVFLKHNGTAVGAHAKFQGSRLKNASAQTLTWPIRWSCAPPALPWLLLLLLLLLLLHLPCMAEEDAVACSCIELSSTESRIANRTIPRIAIATISATRSTKLHCAAKGGRQKGVGHSHYFSVTFR